MSASSGKLPPSYGPPSFAPFAGQMQHPSQPHHPQQNLYHSPTYQQHQGHQPTASQTHQPQSRGRQQKAQSQGQRQGQHQHQQQQGVQATAAPQPSPILQQQQAQQDESPAKPPAVWANTTAPLPRGRAPKDPNARTAKLNAGSIAELEAALRGYLDNPPAAAEHSTCEITLWQEASLIAPDVADDPPRQVNQHSNGPVYTPATVQEALEPAPEGPTETMKKQRSVSKLCVAAVQRVDGYKYSFHNNWKSGEENAFRFSYYCNDSLLNKDRVANGKAGTQGRRATKPVFDCKGVLSVKFSATRACIDVIYKHIPCHDTYEKRAPPPRRDSKRRAMWEKEHADRAKNIDQSDDQLQLEQEQFEAQAGTNAAAGSSKPTVKRVRKRQKKGEANDVNTNDNSTSVESELRQQSMRSLLDLMNQDHDPQFGDVARAGGINGGAPGSVPRAGPMPSPSFGNPLVQPNRVQQFLGTPAPHSCVTCDHFNSRCDRSTPSCNLCSSRNWPCWYVSTEEKQKRARLERVEEECQSLQTQLGSGLDMMKKANKDLEETSRAHEQAVMSRDQMQKTCEQTQQQWDLTKQELKAAQDKTHEVQKQAKESHDRWKESEARVKQLEHQVTQLQEQKFAASQAAAQVATHTTAQMARQTPQPSYTAHQVPPVSVSRTNTLPSYAHTASTNDRNMNPGYGSFYNQAPAPAHTSRGHIFPPVQQQQQQQQQPMVQQNRWSSMSMQQYPQNHDNTNIWDNSHMNNQMR